MNEVSRTTQSVKNAGVNVFFFTIQIVVGFWSRKVFYDYLGSEVLGLDTTAQSLLQFLNIAESGNTVYDPFLRPVISRQLLGVDRSCNNNNSRCGGINVSRPLPVHRRDEVVSPQDFGIVNRKTKQ